LNLQHQGGGEGVWEQDVGVGEYLLTKKKDIRLLGKTGRLKNNAQQDPKFIKKKKRWGGAEEVGVWVYTCARCMCKGQNKMETVSPLDDFF
jgi:hypothetical protein